MATRAEYLDTIQRALGQHGRVSVPQDQTNLIHALLLVASVTANAMSENTEGFASPLVTEATEEMVEVLDRVFDVDI